MADEKHVALLKQGVDAWNAWRRKNDLWPDDWAASPPAGRTFRLPLQMIDLQPAPTLRGGSHALYRERLSNNGNWDCEVVQRAKRLRLHHA
jgi:hypothetical protein